MGGEDETVDVGEAGARVREDLRLLRRVVERRAGEVREELHQLIAEHPAAALGLAFGAGYVLSGALISQASYRAASLMARLFLSRTTRALLLGSGLWRAVVDDPLGGVQGPEESSTHSDVRGG